MRRSFWFSFVSLRRGAMGEAEDPLPMEGTASLFVRVVAMPSVVVARDATGDAVDGTTTVCSGRGRVDPGK